MAHGRRQGYEQHFGYAAGNFPKGVVGVFTLEAVGYGLLETSIEELGGLGYELDCNYLSSL